MPSKSVLLPGATALEQARSAGKFIPVHDAWWAACKIHGDAAGTRAPIEVLLLHRHMTHEHVVTGLTAALRAGAFTPEAGSRWKARKASDAVLVDESAEDSGAQQSVGVDFLHRGQAGLWPRAVAGRGADRADARCRASVGRKDWT